MTNGRVDPVEEQDIRRLLIMLEDERVQMKIVEISLKNMDKETIMQIFRQTTEVPSTSKKTEKENQNGKS